MLFKGIFGILVALSLLNPGFEPIANPAADWQRFDAPLENSYSVFRDCTISHSGQCSERFDMIGSHASYFDDYITDGGIQNPAKIGVSAGTTVQFSFWMTGTLDMARNNFDFGVLFFDANGNSTDYGQLHQYRWMVLNQWTQFTQTLVVPEHTAYAIVQGFSLTYGYDPHSIWIDDVNLVTLTNN